MFTQAANIVKKITSKLKLAAAVATVSLGLVSASQAATDVTAITTQRIETGWSTEYFGVTGYSNEPDSNSTKTYHTIYNGNIEKVTSVTAGNKVYSPTGMANAVVRRYNGPNTDILWYRSAPGVNNAPATSTQVLDSIEATGFNQAFSANNILVGTDNLFTNVNNPASNNTNVERLDVIFTPGFEANAGKGFAIFDRGQTGLHDRFKVAAITGFDSSTGKPTAYGNVLSVAAGSWGNTDLTGPQQYVVTRRNNDIPNDPFHPSVWFTQGMGGIFIPTTDLADAGTQIYGYSIFAADTTSSNLVDWTTYGSSTSENNGGLDAIGTVALLYTASVPEPTGVAALGLSAGLLLTRRNRKARA